MAEPSAVDIEKLHAESKIEQVSLDFLRVDRSYQRDPSQKLVDKIAGEYDEVSSELILVSDRGTRPEEGEVPGGLFIVNGQHRSLGARKHGETQIWARVINLRDHPDPAMVEATFRLRTNVRMGDKPLERFKAQVRAGDEESIAITQIVHSFGTEINETPVGETGINAVAAVERLYRIDETGAILRETLQLVKDTFGYVGGKSTAASPLMATAWFILKHSEESDRGRFVQYVGEGTGLAALDRKARAIASTMGGSLWLNWYRAMVDSYNTNLHEKNRLEWKHGGNTQWKMWGATNTTGPH